MRKALFPLLVASALLPAAASPARAEAIHWSYNFTPTVPTIVSDTNPGSKITLTNEPGSAAAGRSDIVVTNLTTHSDAPRGFPDPFTAAEYGITLRLTDTASGEFADLFFAGQFDGMLSSQSSDIMNTFLGESMHQVQLGNNQYTITVEGYAPPGPPSSSNKGSISSHIEVEPLAIQQAPEPSTLVLSGIGLSLLGVARWRRRRAVPVV